MRRRPEPPNKKPSGSRPAPRRLFSFDALKKEKAGGDDARSETPVQRRSRTIISEGSVLESVENPFTDSKGWTEKQLVDSPVFDETTLPEIQTPPPLDLNKPNPVPPAPEGLAAPPLSPSRRRWDTVRLHVLPSVSSVESIPIQSPPPEVSSFPTRPSTPKLPRFGYRKAFRQVVENVQTQQASEHKRLAEAIRLACWNARFGDTTQHPKPEREGTLGTVGSSLHLPFMSSTTSLPMAPSSSGSTIQGANKSGGLRRPQSTQSLAQSIRKVPTVTHLTRVLSSFSTSLTKSQYLPHENLILSTLLLPFLESGESTQVDVEQVNAVETFEYAVRTWKASSNEAELERCLWCCRAASVPSKSRLRLLGTLSSILFSRDRTFTANSPMILQTLLQGLFSLTYSLSLSIHAAAESESLAGYVSAVCSGSCGQLSPTATEAEFGVPFSGADSEAVIRDILVTESVIRCLEVSDDKRRRWTLRTMLQQYWAIPEPGLKLTRLQTCVHWRKLQAFTSSVLILLSRPADDTYRDVEVIVDLFRTRIVAEIAAMPDTDATGIRSQVIRLILELLCMQDCREREYLMGQFCTWYEQREDWKGSIEDAVRDLIAHSDWPIVLRLIPSVVSQLRDDVQASIVSFILPLMNNRLAADPPEAPCPPLRRFLEDLAQLYPKIFFKPLFTCAAANKDLTVVNQLCILNALSKFVPDLWLRDAEMISVALMSDPPGRSAQTSTDGQLPVSKARIGQCLLMVELLEQLRNVNEAKDLVMMTVATKFVVALEARLGLVIQAKEKTVLFPESHRLLFCSLFREIRLLTRSLKSAPWLESVLSWAIQWSAPTPSDDLLADSAEEVTSTFHKLQAIYVQSQDGFTGTGKRRNTAISILSLEKKASEQSDTSESPESGFTSRGKRVEAILKARKAIPLNLLVLVSGLVTSEHYVRLGPAVWKGLLNDLRASSVIPTCFLAMQFAEKKAEQFKVMVEDELSNSDPRVRHHALQKIGTVSTWRFQITTQDVILDRMHRRPFKMQRPPILFVATDIGSSLFIYEDDEDEYKDMNGHVIPLELRRRLSEIGWAEDRIVDRRLQRIKTPMTLLPDQQLERVDFESEESPAFTESQSPSPSPEPSPTKGNASDTSLGRRDSTSSGRSQGVRRRPVFVAALVELFPQVASLLTDRDIFVADTAQEVILDFMRDDPSLLCRTVFHLISGDEQSLMLAFSTLRAFLHIRHTLPPPTAHHILNHLTGFLKSAMRGTDSPESLRGYGYAMPVISRLALQVSKMSMREIRRAKIDTFLIPSGSLWFTPNAPAGPLFPRHLEELINPFESLPSSLVSIVLIRTSQNLLFLRMLKRTPQDVKVVRKTMTRLVLPSLSRSGDDAVLTLMDLVPYRREAALDSTVTRKVTVRALSLTLARSYLLLIEQVFQCMSRHLNDREELASLMDGINRIMVVHGDDIGIVAHVMLGMLQTPVIRHPPLMNSRPALMTASTRFKRLFLSGGYTLFMPAVIKVYVEAEHHPNIRHAIEYAISRFYALHQDAFIFQTFDVMAQVLTFAHADGSWIASGVFTLFTTLTAPASLAPDAAGIHDLNKPQEQEALMVTIAEEVPQTLIAALKKPGTTQDRNAIDVPIPEQYEGRRLRLDNIVRLFLTVIAHDSGTQRAEQFLKFLRLLAPHLYGASRVVQNVLRDGIDALGSILLVKSSSKSKSSEGPQTRPTEEAKYQAYAEEKEPEQRTAPGDLLTMRLEYLLLVLAYTGAGGLVAHTTTVRIVEMIKALMKDATSSTSERVSSFLASYVRTVLIREDSPPSVKEVITLLEALAPLTGAYATKAGFDLSGLFGALVQLASNPLYSSEPSFSQLLIAQYCRIGLDACELVASEELLFTFPLRTSVVRLVNCLIPAAGADIMEQVESRAPTYDFLSGLLLPIVLTLKTSGDLMADSQWTDNWRRDTYSKVWLRLLAYTLSAFEKRGVSRTRRRSLSMGNAERRKSQSNHNVGRTAAPLMELCMVLQILKIIVIRAEEEISITAPRLWSHIATLLKATLADGDAMFALRGRDYSEPPSPAISPRVSSFQDQEKHPLQTFPSTFSSRSHQPPSPPRIIDYVTWSTIQWLWLRRTPLMIPMRIFIQERIANLAAELNTQGAIPILSAGPGSRPVSTIFSKPRRSMLGPSPMSSASSTPRTSMFINSSTSLPVMSDFAQSKGLSPPRLAGYERTSPISPSGRTSQDLNGHTIVHLGPVQSSTGLQRPISIGSDPSIPTTNARALARETRVRSSGLIRMTYKRIRLIQRLMGYTTLLPFNGSEYVAQDGTDMEARVWTKTAAIEAVVDETKELMAEFNGGDGDFADESMVYIDSQDFLLPSGSQES
ncbi:hypothetical protein NM688_g1961 [Phlebia brevispora]|uniref:Uncharacterized protein n=1 Tax=Phlebia brevispora TaxID=194682 RepID=A0ACC1TAB3_9APHY|nr:hypothetical protein NM688_g1961 [Phlebia brevispora]